MEDTEGTGEREREIHKRENWEETHTHTKEFRQSNMLISSELSLYIRRQMGEWILLTEGM